MEFLLPNSILEDFLDFLQSISVNVVLLIAVTQLDSNSTAMPYKHAHFPILLPILTLVWVAIVETLLEEELPVLLTEALAMEPNSAQAMGTVLQILLVK